MDPVIVALIATVLGLGGGAIWYVCHANRENADKGRSGKNRLVSFLDLLPFPIWLRNKDGSIAIGNRTFSEVSGTTREDGPEPGKLAFDPFFPDVSQGQSPLSARAVRSGVEQTASVSLTVSGQRHLYDVTEVPIGSDSRTPLNFSTLGFARDLTALEAAQSELARHVAAQDQLLEGLASGIAIYGSDKRLRFFNAAFCELWKLEEHELTGRPTLGSVLEMLRERRVLPETADFPAFRKSKEALFTNLIDSDEEYLFLPDERTFKSTVRPHPMDGIVMAFEDVTDRISLERSHNTLTAVQRMTLNGLREGVCVFGSDGRVRLFNEVYARTFGLTSDWLASGPHISDLLEKVRETLDVEANWEKYCASVIRAVAEPKARTGTMTLADDRVVEFTYVPLPDGQCLVLYTDVTDSHRVSRALRERNEAFERADLLKAQFIANVSHELRSPLNTIMGFAQILESGAIEPGSEKANGYISHIMQASRHLNRLIGEILDLAALQSGFLDLTKENHELQDILRDASGKTGVADEFGSEKERRIDFAKGFDGHVPGNLSCDRERLVDSFAVLMDFCFSAIIDGKELAVDLVGQDDGIVVVMRPTVGKFYSISFNNLFVPQISGVPTRLGESEVGIALARNVIEQHHGTISPHPDLRAPEALLITFTDPGN